MVDRVDTVREPPTATALERVTAGRGSGTRARIVTAAWLIALVGIAGFAVAGRLVEPGVPDVSVVAVAPTPASSAPLPASAGMHHLASTDGELIVLTSPAEGDPTITSVELIVQGYLQSEAASLRVTIETDWYRVDEATLLPVLAFGERPGATRHAQFLVRFGLSEPRLIGPMVVRVVALDRDGHLLADALRPFQLGPVERPSLGDDGLLGGLVFSGG